MPPGVCCCSIVMLSAWHKWYFGFTLIKHLSLNNLWYSWPGISVHVSFCSFYVALCYHTSAYDSCSPLQVGAGRLTHRRSGLHGPNLWNPPNTMWLQLITWDSYRIRFLYFLGKPCWWLGFFRSPYEFHSTIWWNTDVFLLTSYVWYLQNNLNYTSSRYGNLISCLRLFFVVFTLNWWYIYFRTNFLSRRKYFYL